MSNLRLVTAPAAEPVSLDDMLQYLGYGPYASLDSTTQSVLTGRITPLIMAARMYCEGYARRAFITQTWELALDGFPGFDPEYLYNGFPTIRLPLPPFQSVASFQYVDTSGTLQTLTADTDYGNGTGIYGYQLDPGGDTQPARLLPPWARPWPPTRQVSNSVLIEFVCGYGDAGSALPPTLAMAVKFLTQFYYEQGAASDAAVPTVVTRLLDQYRNLIS